MSGSARGVREIEEEEEEEEDEEEEGEDSMSITSTFPSKKEGGRYEKFLFDRKKID